MRRKIAALVLLAVLYEVLQPLPSIESVDFRQLLPCFHCRFLAVLARIEPPELLKRRMSIHMRIIADWGEM